MTTTILLCSSPVASSSSASSSDEEENNDILPKIEEVDSSKIIREIIGEYREYLETRFNTYYKVAGAEFKEEQQQQDRLQKNEYVNVLNLLRLSNPEKDSQVCLVLKADGFAQGVLSMKVDRESEVLHISALLTAPWNLRLNAPNLSEYSSQKGVGRQLMQSAYQFAQKNSQKKISLQPMENSVGFYKHIGMTKEDESLIFDIDPYSIPMGLAD